MSDIEKERKKSMLIDATNGRKCSTSMVDLIYTYKMIVCSN